jgi:hypothetical protein
MGYTIQSNDTAELQKNHTSNKLEHISGSRLYESNEVIVATEIHDANDIWQKTMSMHGKNI